MDVGCGMRYSKRNTCTVDHQVTLRAPFTSIRRVRSDLLAPPGAGTLAESNDARDQSMRFPLPRKFKRVLWRRFHTPASCHCLRRRQQVMPDPQPISLGSISQGMPVFNTSRIPVNTARSAREVCRPWVWAARGARAVLRPPTVRRSRVDLAWSDRTRLTGFVRRSKWS
jgi:hypothetical protein